MGNAKYPAILPSISRCVVKKVLEVFSEPEKWQKSLFKKTTVIPNTACYLAAD